MDGFIPTGDENEYLIPMPITYQQDFEDPTQQENQYFQQFPMMQPQITGQQEPQQTPQIQQPEQQTLQQMTFQQPIEQIDTQQFNQQSFLVTEPQFVQQYDFSGQLPNQAPMVQNITEYAHRPEDYSLNLWGFNEIVGINRHYFDINVNPTLAFSEIALRPESIERYIPYNENIFKLRFGQSSNTNAVLFKIVTFDFDEMRFKVMTNKELIRDVVYCDDDIFNTCLLLEPLMQTNDAFWIVFLKMMKFVPSIINDTLQKQIYDIVQLQEKVIQIDSEGGISKRREVINKLFDIQVVDVSLEKYTITGFRCYRGSNDVLPFYFQVIKSEPVDDIPSKYFVVTNLFNRPVDITYEQFNFDELGKPLVITESSEIGKIPARRNEQTIIQNGETINTYAVGKLNTTRIPVKEIIVLRGMRDELIRGIHPAVRRVLKEDRQWYYDPTKPLKPRQSVNSWRKIQRLVNEGYFETEDVVHHIGSNIEISLNFVITVPYDDMPIRWMNPVYEPYIVTYNEFLTLMYELTLVNGDGFLQLPPIVERNAEVAEMPEDNQEGMEEEPEMRSVGLPEQNVQQPEYTIQLPVTPVIPNIEDENQSSESRSTAPSVREE